MQRYIIITNCQPPAFTPWFDPENHFNAAVGMTVIDLHEQKYTDTGLEWNPMDEDHL